MKKHLLLVIFFLGYSVLAQQNNASPIVLELFTSQGCSSCPAADELVSKTKQENKNTIVLSYHVAYWNYIGWKDPFSKKSYASIQREYAAKFNSSSIYTPQVVINGKEHFVGSDRKILNLKMYAYSQTQLPVNVSIDKAILKGEKVTFDFKTHQNIEDSQIIAFLLIKERSTPIPSGENRGRTLNNSNIIVNLKTIDKNTHSGYTIEVPDFVKKNDSLELVILIKDSELNILGAASLAI